MTSRRINDTCAKSLSHEKQSGKAFGAFTLAPITERERLPHLLKTLCDGVELERAPCMADQPISLREAIYCAVMRIYSGRHADADLRTCVERGFVSQAWGSYTILRAFWVPAATEILVRLIEESAAPLAEIENVAGQFAVGATLDDPEYDPRVGRRRWIYQRLHLMIGTATKVVTSARVSPEHDASQLPELLAATAKRFSVKEVSASGRYLCIRNIEAICAAGAIPLIPFNRPAFHKAGSEAWNRSLLHFHLDATDFHRRSRRCLNVNATIQAIKALAGPVRSHAPVARANDFLGMVLLHNLTRVIYASERQALERPELTAVAA